MNPSHDNTVSMPQRLPRDHWLAQSDAQLLQACAIDTYRASGPGGQKRNKTSSAVRLRHLPTGLLVIAEESRSQHENKAKALQRLRQAFVLHERMPVTVEIAKASPALLAVRNPDGRFVASKRHPHFWQSVGVLLDLLVVCGLQVSTVAEHLGTSTANVIAFLAEHPKVWQQFNHYRVQAGLHPLKSN
jgi:hypothetical protein